MKQVYHDNREPFWVDLVDRVPPSGRLVGLIALLCALGGGTGYTIGIVSRSAPQPVVIVQNRVVPPDLPPPPPPSPTSWPELSAPPASEEPPPLFSHPADKPAKPPAALPSGAPSAQIPQPAKPLTPPVVATIAPLPPIPSGPTGDLPWLRNAVAPRETNGRPAIAIVIDDMGVDRKRSMRAVALPGPLTMSYLPYGEDLPHQTAQARAAGHELLVHMPMEPRGDHIDPGPGALAVALSTEEIAERLNRNLAAFSGYVGINNHMGSRFTSFTPGMAAVMAQLKGRGLLWLDSRTYMTTVGGELAQQYGVPHIDRDVFLDDEMTQSSVRAELAQLEAIAIRNGHAVAIGHPRDATLAVLTPWLAEIERRGFVLVPLSQLVRARTPSGNEVAAVPSVASAH